MICSTTRNYRKVAENDMLKDKKQEDSIGENDMFKDKRLEDRRRE